MLGWYAQWNGYVPGWVGAVNVAWCLPSITTLNVPEASGVTVCAAESLLITVTSAPGGTVTSVNLNPSIVIVAAAGAGDDDAADDDVGAGALDALVFSVTFDFPHAGAIRIATAANIIAVVLVRVVIAFPSPLRRPTEGQSA
jgi:hypothetical protein